MSFDLTNKNISDTFQNLLQKTGSEGHLYDLEGNQVDNLTIGGTLTAHSYVTSESIVNTSSGSTAFGNTADDSHIFIGNITASGNISASGDLVSAGIYLDGVRRTTWPAASAGDWYDGSTYQSSSLDIIVEGFISASGNISSSGTITMLTASIGGGIFTSASLAAGGTGGGDLSNIVEDETPQLGGNLDLNTNTISGSGNVKFSGSLEVNSVNATDDFFLLKSGSLNALKVNGEGVLRLGGFTFTPTAVSGGFYYNDSDDEFYLGKK